MEDKNKDMDEPAERAAVCRAVAEQFALSEGDVSDAVFLAADWPGEVPEGAVLLVKTGTVIPAGDAEAVAQSWMKVNDRLEEEGVGLYCEVKGDALTVFYRYY